MIARNFLISLFVLLAGLITGYFTAGSSGFSNICYSNRDRIQQVIDGGFKAVNDTIATNDHLLDYYSQLLMNYYRWIDTGDPQAKVSFKLAMGQFKSVLNHHKEKYKDDLSELGLDLQEAEKDLAVAENTVSAVRWARVIIVVALFLLVMGIPGFVRDRAHQKFAGSLYFDANFRPFTITSLTSYHGTRRLAILMVVLYILGLAVFSSFTSLLFPLSLGILGLLYVLGLALLFNSGRNLCEVVVSLMAPQMIIVVVLLFMVAIRGPIYFWYNIWVSDLFRMIFLSFIIMLVFRKFQVHVVLGRKWSQRNVAGSAAMVFLVLGFQLVLAGFVLLFFGPEESLTAFNEELPIWIIWIATVMVLVSLVVFLLNRKVRNA